MARFGARADDGKQDSVIQSGDEAVQLVIDYVKQETLGPLKGLQRFIVYGVSGSLALAVGLVLLLIAVLRLLQTETSAFVGNLSWLPYVIVSVLGVAVIGLAAWRVTAGPAARRRPAAPPAAEDTGGS